MKPTHLDRVIIMVCILSMLLNACGSQLKYSRGMDSHEVFGDGEFQLVKYTDNGVECYELYNYKHSMTVLSNISQYWYENGKTFFDGYCPLYITRTARMMIALDTKTNSFSAIFDGNEMPNEIVTKIRNYFGGDIESQINELLDASNYPGGFERFIRDKQ